MSSLEIAVNNDIDTLILQLQEIKQVPGAQTKLNSLDTVKSGLVGALDLWNYKLEKYRNGV